MSTSTESPLDLGQQKAAETAEAASARAASFGQMARDQARTAASSVKEMAETKVEDTRDTLADTVDGTARSLEEAAARMTDGSPQADAVAQAAQATADAANRIRETDLSQLRTDAARFARRNPLLFLAGATLAGAAVGRFLKASAPQSKTADWPDLTTHHIPRRTSGTDSTGLGGA